MQYTSHDTQTQASRGIFITTSQFTPDAKVFAERLNVCCRPARLGASAS